LIDLNSQPPKLQVFGDHYQDVQYVALSYCWGGVQAVKLLVSNFKDMVSRIPSELPKTIQDAFTITRRLGIRFIWVDSLCIIQDSEKDWITEAALMGRVYKNCFCCIAASGATDSSKGCFLRSDLYSPMFRLRTRWRHIPKVRRRIRKSSEGYDLLVDNDLPEDNDTKNDLTDNYEEGEDKEEDGDDETECEEGEDKEGDGDNETRYEEGDDREGDGDDEAEYEEGGDKEGDSDDEAEYEERDDREGDGDDQAECEEGGEIEGDKEGEYREGDGDDEVEYDGDLEPIDCLEETDHSANLHPDDTFRSSDYDYSGDNNSLEAIYKLESNYNSEDICSTSADFAFQNEDEPPGHSYYLSNNWNLGRVLGGYVPLFRRAWAFQERLLSPRVLHYAMDQLFWECREHEACQFFPFGLPPDPKDRFGYADSTPVTEGFTRLKSLFPVRGKLASKPLSLPGRSGTRLYDARIALPWSAIVSKYSSGGLTKLEDKLPALAGVASEFQLLGAGIYLAGLWQCQMPFGLLWAVSNGRQVDDKPSFRPKEYRAPSWSWASVEGMIDFQWSFPRDKYTEPLRADFVEVTVKVLDDNEGPQDSSLSPSRSLTGPVLEGFLRIRGCLGSATWGIE
jgi:hypothetical protein